MLHSILQTVMASSNASLPLEGVQNGPAEPGSSPQQPVALLDFFFPGFSMFTAAVQRYLGLDLNMYIPLFAILGGLIATWQYFSSYFWRQVEVYFMSTVDIRIDDEIYNMLMGWVAQQRFAKSARRFVANTNLNSRCWFLWRWDDDDEEDDENGEDEEGRTRMSLIGGRKKKALAYTPTFGSHYFFYKGRLLIFRRDRGRDNGVGFFMTSEKEEISVSCFGRNPQILKDLLLEARTQFIKRDEAKTLIYRGTLRAGSTEPTWQRMMARVSRPFSTVILNEQVKKDLVADVSDYLNPATRRWYGNRGIPYRRGYLLYGPPGTGKSSLSLALAGYFKMRIYIVSLSSISSTEENLASLFAELPRRCVVLLEDIDTAGLTHTREEDGTQSNSGGGGGGGGDPTPQKGLRGNEKGGDSGNNSNNNAFRLSLSGLLNILDGVASQEGRVLIMTTNHIEKLDKALIRPGRVDLIVKFGKADTSMVESIFRAIFAPLEADTPPTRAKLPTHGSTTTTTAAVNGNDAAKGGDDPDEVLKGMAAERAAREAAIARVDKLAAEYASKIPAHEFSPAELQGYLLKNKRDPGAAVAGAEAWVAETRREKAEKEVKDAEEKRQKEEEKRKKEEEEKEEKDKKKKKKKNRRSSKRKSKSNKDQDHKKDESTDVSESESSSGESSSASESESESEAEDKRKSRKKANKSKAKKKAAASDIKITVEKVSGGKEATAAGKAEEPVSAATEKSDEYVDVENEGPECVEVESRPKTRGSDSGYSTP